MNTHSSPLSLIMRIIRLLAAILACLFACALAQTGAGRAVMVDAAGDVVVAGWTASHLNGENLGEHDAFVAKFDTDGKLLWLRQFGSDQSDYVLAVAVDAAGNIIVAGSTSGDLAGQNQGVADAFLAKFDTNGDQLWIRQFGSTHRASARDVAADEIGNIFLVGDAISLQAGDRSSMEAFLAKYDSVGERLWLRPISLEGYEYAFGVSVDSDGNVYVTGATSKEPIPSSPAGTNAYVAKLDANGQQLWVVQFGGILNDFAYAMQVDRDGNTFVTGTTSNSLGRKDYLDHEYDARIALDAFLAKIDALGHVVWIRQFGAGQGYMGHDVAVDSAGHAIVVGNGYGNLGGEPQGLSDAFVVKYTSDGTMLWAHRFGTPRLDGAYGVAVDAADHIFVTGYLDGDSAIPHYSGKYLFLAKYDPNGNQLWLRRFQSPAADPEPSQ